MNLRLAASVAVCLVLLSTPALAQGLSWPGFRGPDCLGLAPQATPPIEWNDKKNVAWKTRMPGPGASSPIVLDNRVYLTCYSGYGYHLDDGGDKAALKHHLVCVERKTGKIVWNTPVPGPLEKEASQMHKNEHGFATPTPVTDGKHIFAYFGPAGVVAFDQGGTVLWKEKLGKPEPDAPKKTNGVVRDGKALTLRWGAAASPVLCDGLVIVNCSEESNSIRALNKETGKLVWKRESANLEGSAISPIVVRANGKPTLIVALAGAIWAINPQSGKELWKVETESRGGMSPTPVADDKLVYCFGGFGKSHALRLSLGKKEAAAAAATSKPARVAWRGENLDIPSPILHQGKLILVRQSGIAVYLDAKDGATLHSGRLEGRTSKIYASPVVAGNRMYVVSRKRGTFVYEIDASKKGKESPFKLLARNELQDESIFNASPAVVGQQMFLRSDEFLYCIAK